MITISSAFDLSSVTFTFTGANSGILKYGNVVVESENPISVTGKSAAFYVANSGTASNGQIKITAIEVVYLSNVYTSSPSVTITINGDGIMTYASVYGLDFSQVDGLTAYFATEYNKDNMSLTMAP